MTYETPPDRLTVDGVEFCIDTDFRRWIEFYCIAKEGGGLIEFLNSLGLPLTESAANAACDFFVGPTPYGCGGTNGEPTVDFYVDAEAIYSAFYSAYKIDLTSEKIHWWKFMALFRSLPQDCELSRIMQYRGVNIKDVPKYQKKFYAEMKSKYSLNKKSGMTLEERNEDMKRRVDEAYKKAEMQVPKMRGNK